MDSKIEAERSRIFSAKKKYHGDLAKLPFEEKLKISRRLAKVAANLKAADK